MVEFHCPEVEELVARLENEEAFQEDEEEDIHFELTNDNETNVQHEIDEENEGVLDEELDVMNVAANKEKSKKKKSKTKKKKRKDKRKHCDESLKKKEGSEDEEIVQKTKKRRVIIESESDDEDLLMGTCTPVVWKTVMRSVQGGDEGRLLGKWFACIYTHPEENSKRKSLPLSLIFGKLLALSVSNGDIL